MTVAEEEAIELDGMLWRDFCVIWRFISVAAGLAARIGVWVMPEGAKA